MPSRDEVYTKHGVICPGRHPFFKTRHQGMGFAANLLSPLIARVCPVCPDSLGIPKACLLQKGKKCPGNPS